MTPNHAHKNIVAKRLLLFFLLNALAILGISEPPSSALDGSENYSVTTGSDSNPSDSLFDRNLGDKRLE
jgi:hypothetical protein